ncbi:MAG: ATP-binding cassette domain-containing protein [Clostridiales bacterium]|nr:ATP-binding cassette domain-containing protein [Candidatus Coliplasma caballi]
MIELQHLQKTFHTAGGDVKALKDVSLVVPDGDIVGIIGLSGAGKSTLVRCMNLLERPDNGKILLGGRDLTILSEKELRPIRKEVTMIFQDFRLLQQRNCLKNVCFPLELAGVGREEARKRGKELLELVGLGDRCDSYPSQLSGGQQQRVAIARALATDPKVLLCDEATSALDPTTTRSILELLRSINEKLGITIILITHSMQVVETICRHVAILDKGVVAEYGDVEEVFSSPKTAAAKHLVFPEGDEAAHAVDSDGMKQVRVVFNGSDATGKPLIATMAIELGISANILYASTRNIGRKTYGSMLLGIPGGEAELQKALSYLEKAEDVTVKEVKQDE